MPTPSMTIVADDAVTELEVAAFLRSHLHKDKIIVLGHSWGTVLGLRMVRQQGRRCSSAYVGTGQLVDKGS